MRYYHSILLTAAVGLIITGTLLAAAPKLVSYQGRLTEASGDIVADGAYDLTFSIYSDSTGGSLLWSSGVQPVSVTEGLFTYVLGSHTPLPMSVFSGASAWLNIAVEGESITPRTRFNSAAYALSAEHADTAEYAREAAGWERSGNRAVLTNVNDSVGIGTAMPTAKLQVGGTIYSQAGGFKFPDGTVQTTAAATGTPSGWVDNGATVVLQDTSNFVGIGTISPNGPLHIHHYGINIINYDNFTNRVAPFVLGDDNPANGAILMDGNQIEQARTTDRLYLNYSSSADISMAMGGGKVGIGTNTPAQRLHVEGDVYTTGVVRHPPRTSYLSIPAAAFENKSLFGDYRNVGEHVELEPSNYAYPDTATAPVYLPNGALITGITLYYKDSSLSGVNNWDGVMTLRRTAMNGVSDVLATLSTSGSLMTTYTSTSMAGPYHTVDNGTFAYFIKIVSRFHIYYGGVRIQYTTTTDD